MATFVVTDSSACLSPRLARRLPVRVVPIGIVFGHGPDARDDTVDPERVHRALARHQPVKSVPPSVLDYVAAIEAVPPGDHVLVLTPATEFTVMCRTARLAAGLADRRVDVVDTRTAASAQGLVVEVAARAAAGGAEPAAVLEATHDAVARARLIAALGTLDALEEGGLVPSPSLEAARRGGASPMFAFRDGAVEAIGHDEDGDPAAALVDEWQRRGGRAGTDARVFHAGALGLAQQVRSQLGPPVGPPARFSPAMTLHTGVGLVGIAWLSSPA
jgi:DegV family protein with EDD domain